MEDDQNGQAKAGKLSITLWVVIAFVLLVTVIISITAIRSSLKKLSAWENIPGDSLVVPAALFEKKAHLSYLEKLISLAEGDSIIMAINLPDSFISLELKGVEVHKVKISGIRLDPVLKNMSPQGLMSLTDTVFHVTRSEASILKEPIVYKKAPKDTAEANRTPDSIPAPKKETVWFTCFAGPFELHFRQNEPLSSGEARRAFGKDLSRRWYQMKGWFSSALGMKSTSYTPRIVLEITAEEASLLYRALPQKPAVVLKIAGG